jgi:hypothetical protein
MFAHLAEAVPMNALAISAFLDTPTSPFLSPQKVAQRLSLKIEDLAQSAHVHRNSLRVRPQGAKIQNFLRQLVRVISAAEAAFGDRDTAIVGLMNEPLAPFEHRTAFDLVRQERTDDVVAYLGSINSGFAG